MATSEAVYSAIRSQRPEWIVEDGPNSFGNFRMSLQVPPHAGGEVGLSYGEFKNQKGQRRTIQGKQAIYMGGDPKGYLLRETVFDHYMGEGPVDFLL